MDQRTDEWRQAKCGKLGCSRLDAALAQGRNGAPSATRRNYLAELVCERLTGNVSQGFTTAEEQWGIDHESFAKAAYEARSGVIIQEHGGMEHPTIKGWWGSPDGLIGSDGGIEIKCPKTATHLDTLLRGTIDRGYILQMTGYILIYDRAWWDFISFDPRLPDRLSIFIKRFYRDDLPCAEVESGARQFLVDLESMLERLAQL